MTTSGSNSALKLIPKRVDISVEASQVSSTSNWEKTFDETDFVHSGIKTFKQDIPTKLEAHYDIALRSPLTYKNPPQSTDFCPYILNLTGSIMIRDRRRLYD